MKNDFTPLPSLPYNGKKFDVMACLQCRKRIILVLGSVLFLLLVPFAIVKGSFVFEVSSKFLIARETPTLTRQADENIVSYFHDYSKTQVERIGSLAIVEEAIKSLPADIRLRIKPQDLDYATAAAKLKKDLLVEDIPNTHLLLLKLNGSSSDGLAEMLNAIMDTYLRKLQSEEENKDARKIAFLGQERNHLEKQVQEIKAELENLAVSTKSTSFLDSNNIYLSRYLNLQSGYLEAFRTRLASTNEYQETQVMVEDLKKLPNKVLADEMVANDQSIWQTANWTYQKLQELRATMDGIAKNNPDRHYVEQRMVAMQDYERKSREEIRVRDEGIVNQKRDYELAKKLIEARYSRLATEKNEAELKNKMDEALAILEKVSLEMLRGQELLKSFESKRSKLFEVEDRIRSLELESKSPPRVTIESYAVKPDSPSGSNLKKLYLMTVLLSFGIVALLFLVHDFLDNRIRSPNDITHYLGHPPTWPISRYPSPEHGGITTFGRVTLDDPGHTVAKAIRSLAVRLNKERLKHEASIALMTAANERSGTTGITINTAQAMKHFCERVLIIDGNAIHPGLIEMAGLQDNLPERIVGEAFGAAVVRDEERGLDFLSLSGMEWTAARRRQLPALFERLSGEYDFILVDSAPLFSTDATELLVTLAHVVVLIAQGDRTMLKDFARTTELILRLEIPAMAAVLNWGGIRPLNWFDGMVAKIPFPMVRQVMQRLNEMGNRV